MTERDLVPSEPITVVLSEKGWIRHAKGHEVDAEGLNYKSGDKFLASAKGKSNQQAVFLGSDGRSYFPLNLIHYHLREVKVELITGRLNISAGTSIRQVVKWRRWTAG